MKLKSSYINDFDADSYPPVSYIDNYRASFSPQSFHYFYSKKNNIFNGNYFRPRETKEAYNNKKSILIFGCSFAFGAGLNDNEIISSKLSEKTKRNVFNFGICASGISHMLALLQNEQLLEKFPPPEYVIYIYIPSHIERLRANIFPHPLMANGLNLQYRIKNNSLKLHKLPFDLLSKTFIVKSLYYQLDIKRDNSNIENKYKNFALANEIFLESKRLLQEKYPDIKFVILRYEVNDDEIDHEFLFMRDVLKQEGFTIINSSELIGRKFNYHSQDTTFDNYHPSEKAWDLLCPELIKKLNL